MGEWVKDRFIPMYCSDIESKGKLKSFTEWLVARGAEVLTPTNEYEVLRIRATKGVSVLYRNNRQTLRWTGELPEAWQAFAAGGAWKGNDPAARPKANRRRGLMGAIFKRDGEDCFYCGTFIEDGQETLEHLFPVRYGGLSHLANVAAAHKSCNENAGHLSVIEKVLLREKMRAGRLVS